MGNRFCRDPYSTGGRKRFWALLIAGPSSAEERAVHAEYCNRARVLHLGWRGTFDEETTR